MVVLGLLETGDRGIHEGERTSSGHACHVSSSRMWSDWHLRIYVNVFGKATDTKGAKCLCPCVVQSAHKDLVSFTSSPISLSMVCCAKYFRINDESFSLDFNGLFFHKPLANLDDQAICALPPYLQ